MQASFESSITAQDALCDKAMRLMLVLACSNVVMYLFGMQAVWLKNKSMIAYIYDVVQM